MDESAADSVKPDVEDVVDAVDPLANIIEKTMADPGAAFAPETLTAIAELKKADRAAFETLRAGLKRTGCRVTALDEALAEESGSGAANARPQTQTDILLRLAQAADLFHTPDLTCYADLDIKGHRETWLVRSRGFDRWLARAFFDETNGAPGSEAMAAALNVIEAKAHYDADERPVHTRVAHLNGKLYLDLCDAAWRAVEIDETGWRIVDTPPVRFRRASGALPLPVPERGGKIDDLRPFLNVRSDRDFVLIVAWELAAFLDHGPYPVLAFASEQGSAKSTASKILRALIDPNTAPLRALPRNDRELFISATNAHLLVYDNVSGLQPWLSDTLCRLSSGGGFSVRSLWTNNDEVLFEAARPAILNGIEDIITRPDLADRSLFVTLEAISDQKRREDNELLTDFEAKRARILGVLLDALATGLRLRPTTNLPEKPRMADFAAWATACETAFWPAGTFLAAYNDNLREVVDTVIDADAVGSAVRQMATQRSAWTGTATDLLRVLGVLQPESATRAKNWPGSPDALSNRLRRSMTFLRKAGVNVSFSRRGQGADADHTYRRRLPQRREGVASEVSVVSAPPSTPKDIKDLDADTSADTMARGPDQTAAEGSADAGPGASVRQSVRGHSFDIADEKAATDTMGTSDASPSLLWGPGRARPPSSCRSHAGGTGENLVGAERNARRRRHSHLQHGRGDIGRRPRRLLRRSSAGAEAPQSDAEGIGMGGDRHRDGAHQESGEAVRRARPCANGAGRRAQGDEAAQGSAGGYPRARRCARQSRRRDQARQEGRAGPAPRPHPTPSGLCRRRPRPRH